MEIRRTLLSCCAILAFSGCAAQGAREEPTHDAATEDHKTSADDQPTRIWMRNLTGEPIRQVRFNCEDINGSRDYTYATDIGKQETEIWSRKSRESFVLKSMTITFEDGSQSDFIVDHPCKPGDQVLLILDIAGRMKVQTKE